MFNKEEAKSLIETIESHCIHSERFHEVLGELILNGALANHPDLQLPAPIHEAIQKYWADPSCKEPWKEELHQALHHSWCRIHGPLSDFPGFNRTVPEMLVWGYEQKLIYPSITEFTPGGGIELKEVNLPVLKAFWETVSIGGALSVSIGFSGQSLEAWRIICDGIAQCRLTTLEFKGPTYIYFSPEQWRLFWEAINSSSLKHLDGQFLHITENKDQVEKHWKVICDGLSASHIESLSLNSLFLDKLEVYHWTQFYHACKKVGLRSLNFHSASFFGVATRRKERESWAIVCKLLSLPTLKSLTLSNEHFGCLSLDDWNSFCNALSYSNLENLTIEISTFASEEHWLVLIESLEKIPLKDFEVRFWSAKELTPLVVERVCQMIEKSTLRSIVMKNCEGLLAFPAELWVRLGMALAQRSIKTFNFGTIDLSDENMPGFMKGINLSGVRTLCLHGESLNCLSYDKWEYFAASLKESRVVSLNIEKASSMQIITGAWFHFCKLIENNTIKELSASFFSSNIQPGFLYETALSLNRIGEMKQALSKSNLKILNIEDMNFLLNYSTPIDCFREIFQAIDQSKIVRLIHNINPNFLNSEKRKIFLTTLERLDQRAKEQCTLVQLCVDTLFNKYNARLTETGIRYEHEGKVWNEPDISVLEREMIWSRYTPLW